MSFITDFHRICLERAKLSTADTEIISEIKTHLQLIADIANADVFLDVLLDKDVAIVAAQARPMQGSSAYEKDIVGEYASVENEPAVFHAFSVGMPICDLKAVTQESRTVRQNAVPIRNPHGDIIAVLVREKDVSEAVQQEKKFEELARNYESGGPDVRSPYSGQEQTYLALREMHHRIKNNLQLIASILNLQARRFSDPEIKQIFRENISRVLSIAAIHEILINSPENIHSVSSTLLLENLARNLASLVPPQKDISLHISCDEISLPPSVASSIALVITELVSNAFSHAFIGRDRGCVFVTLWGGNQFHTVSIRDDGVGFDVQAQNKSSLGLSIVNATVHDKLKGRTRICSSSSGTTVSFDFRCP